MNKLKIIASIILMNISIIKNSNAQLLGNCETPHPPCPPIQGGYNKSCPSREGCANNSFFVSSGRCPDDFVLGKYVGRNTIPCDIIVNGVVERGYMIEDNYEVLKFSQSYAKIACSYSDDTAHCKSCSDKSTDYSYQVNYSAPSLAGYCAAVRFPPECYRGAIA